MSNCHKLSNSVACAVMINACAGALFFEFSRGEKVNAYYIGCVSVYYLTNFIMLYYGKKLLSALPGRVSLNLFLMGAFLVVGGAIFDMAATVICCPGLEREANPLILMLLSEKIPLNIIYAATVLMNLVEGIIQLVLFACFLKAYPILVQSIPYKNMLTTLKWIFGMGETQSWKKVFIGKIDYFYFIPSFAFLWIIQSLYRFYMALMWFDKVPHSFQVVPLSIIGLAIVGLGLFTHYRVKQKHEAEFKLQ